MKREFDQDIFNKATEMALKVMLASPRNFRGSLFEDNGDFITDLEDVEEHIGTTLGTLTFEFYVFLRDCAKSTKDIIEETD